MGSTEEERKAYFNNPDCCDVETLYDERAKEKIKGLNGHKDINDVKFKRTKKWWEVWKKAGPEDQYKLFGTHLHPERLRKFTRQDVRALIADAGLEAKYDGEDDCSNCLAVIFNDGSITFTFPDFNDEDPEGKTHLQSIALSGSLKTTFLGYNQKEHEDAVARLGFKLRGRRGGSTIWFRDGCFINIVRDDYGDVRDVYYGVGKETDMSENYEPVE